MEPKPQANYVPLSQVQGTAKAHAAGPIHKIGNYCYEIKSVAGIEFEGEFTARYEVVIYDSEATRVLAVIEEDATETLPFAIESYEDRYKDYYGYEFVDLQEAQPIVSRLREVFEDFLTQNETVENEAEAERLGDKLNWILNLELIRIEEQQ